MMTKTDGLSVAAALDHLHMMGFQVIGFDWRWVYVNPAAAAQGHRRREDLVGRVITDEFPGIERQRLFQMMRGAMDTRVSQWDEILFDFPDGVQRWFDVRVEPVPDGICVYSLDIHERKLRQLGQPHGRG